MIKNQEGQSLLEVLTALGVASVVIVALSVLAVSALRNAQHAKAQAEAAKYVSEAIEEVRAVRDQRGWSDFSTYAVDACYKVNRASSPWSLETSTVVCGGGGEAVGSSKFNREIKLERQDLAAGSPGCLGSNPCPGRKITVSVYWTDAFGPNTSQATTILTEWK